MQKRPNGIYVSETEFLNFSEDPTRPTTMANEIAVRSRTLDWWGLSNLYLPNPDPILKSQGKDIRVYQDLMTDDRVSGSITNRVNATLALQWDIDKGKSKSRQAKAIKDIFSNLPMNRIIEEQIKNPRGFGYGPTEVVMIRKDGINVPIDLKAKPQRWFVFSPENQMRFLTKENLLHGIELPERRFLCPTNEASYDNPYGMGLLSRCFWPVTFKRGGWRFWVQFAEKFGQVWPVGKLPRSATKEQREEMLDSLTAMIADGCSVIPDDGSVELQESGSKTASSDLFRAIIQEANTAISTVWLGHAGAGESASGGKFGDDKMSIEVRKDVRDSDVRLCEETFNQLIDWICIENWGSAQGAPRFTFIIEKEVDLPQAERDEKLSASIQAMGLKLTKDYFQRTYNLEDSDIEETASQPPPDSGGGAAGGGGRLALASPDKMFLGERKSGEEINATNPEFCECLDCHEITLRAFKRCPHCRSKLPQFFSEGDAQPDNADVLAESLNDQARPIMDGWFAALRKELDVAGNLIDFRQDMLDVSIDIGPMGALLRDALLLSNLLGRYEVLNEDIGALLAAPAFSSFAEPSVVSALRLPFAEAIKFFRDKVNIPTERWNDLWLDAHTRGFMIAGAMKGDLLSDLRDAVDQTISLGLTLREFRNQWDQIVERHGWSYNGGRNWRTRVVYETNTRQAYNAGRWQQMTDPDVLRTRPYLLYKHGDSVHPRPLHLAWDGTVLPADDEWWIAHAPQNGWGCKCKVFSVGERDLARIPNVKRKAAADGYYEWTDKQGRTFTIPNGIDPGFQYNPGTSAKQNFQVLNDRISQLPPDIAKRIRADIAQKEAA